MIYVHTRARSYNPVWRRHYIYYYTVECQGRVRKSALVAGAIYHFERITQ